MKTNRSSIWFPLACGIVFVFCAHPSTAGAAERAFFRDGQVWVVDRGVETPLLESIKLAPNITVLTNGAFQVADHPPRAFEEGQILGADGMLLSPNGRIEPVIDHVALGANRTILSLNGQPIEINQELPLGTDKKLIPERALVGNDGSWMRVIEGQLFTPDGHTIPAVDTVTLQNGQVIVQKEGVQFPVPADRTIMMNEGTKVFGDGKVMRNDGEVIQLVEGEILTLEGVVKLR